MGCLKKIIQFLCNYDSNRIHPVDNSYIESDDYNFYESELNRSRSLNLRNTRRNTRSKMFWNCYMLACRCVLERQFMS